MNPRLGIVVPYRNRPANLDAFLPHMQRFFAEDSLNRDISVRLLIVEQTAGSPFNRGAIKNIGFQYLAPEVDYICFHDVDLVPIAADYRWPTSTSMIAFHGLDFEANFVRQLFGGVVLLQKQHFEQANGYSNDYLDWGYEDVDLRERLLRCSLKPEHREGHFKKLPHIDEGSNADGTPSEAHLRNRTLYTRRWFQQAESRWYRQPNPSDVWKDDGLNSLVYEEVEPRSAPFPPRISERLNVERVLVSRITNKA
jgi:hypothetical protein